VTKIALKEIEDVDMTNILFAPIREQGVEFVAVCVKDHVVKCSHTGKKVVAQMQAEFGVPVVLVGERSGRSFGRRDLARFMANVSLSRIPWRRGNFR
jgi:hypothetical protein